MALSWDVHSIVPLPQLAPGIFCQPLSINGVLPDKDQHGNKIPAWPIVVPSENGQYQVCFTYDKEFRDVYVTKGLCGLDPSFRNHFKHDCPEHSDNSDDSCGPCQGFFSRLLDRLLGKKGAFVASYSLFLIIFFTCWVHEIVRMIVTGKVDGPPIQGANSAAGQGQTGTPAAAIQKAASPASLRYRYRVGISTDSQSDRDTMEDWELETTESNESPAPRQD